MLKAGDFFTGSFPPGSGKRRRFIVVTDEVQGECTIVWVFLSTSMSDPTVVLAAGSHPEITRDCAVVYEAAAVVDASTITRAVSAGALERCAPLDDDLLARVQEGFFDSDATPLGVVEYCTDRI